MVYNKHISDTATTIGHIMQIPVTAGLDSDTQFTAHLTVSDTDLTAADTVCRHHVTAGEPYFLDVDNLPTCSDCFLNEIIAYHTT